MKDKIVTGIKDNKLRKRLLDDTDVNSRKSSPNLQSRNRKKISAQSTDYSMWSKPETAGRIEYSMRKHSSSNFLWYTLGRKLNFYSVPNIWGKIQKLKTKRQTESLWLCVSRNNLCIAWSCRMPTIPAAHKIFFYRVKGVYLLTVSLDCL